MEVRVNQEDLNKYLGTANLIARVALQVGIAVGVLITIIYSGSIGYYPAGLTIGDVLFFVAASLSFSFSYALVVFVLLSAGITLSPTLRWTQKLILSIPMIRRKLCDDSNELFMINFPKIGWDEIPFVLFGLIVLSLIVSMYYRDFEKALGLTFAVFLMSILYGLWHTKPWNLSAKKTETKVKFGLAVLITLIPLAVTKSQGSILNQAMNLIGVRNENVVVQLSDEYIAFLVKNNIGGASESDKHEGVYHNSKILFRGIGEYTVVEVEGFQLTIPNEEVLIGRQVQKEVSN